MKVRQASVARAPIYVDSETTFATCPQPSLLISESQLLLLAPNRDAMQQSARQHDAAPNICD
jgi:hypothetical protein